MTDSAVQLFIHGKQDNFLTKTPSINFLKKEIEQYTNLATSQLIINPNVNPDFGRLMVFDISGNSTGDFLSKVFLEINLPPLTGGYWTQSIGFAIIKKVSLYIGIYKIEEITPEFMDISHALTKKNESYDYSIGRLQSHLLLVKNAEINYTLKVPLNFWFGRDFYHSLPIYLMTQSAISVHVEFKTFEECVIPFETNTSGVVNKNGSLSANLLVDFINVDNTSFIKEKLAAEFRDNWNIMEQTQYSHTGDITGRNVKIPIPFNLPCKELLWVFREQESLDNNDVFNYSVRNTTVGTPILPLMSSAQVYIENIKRTEQLPEDNFRILNSMKYHSNVSDRYIYNYSFCLFPEQTQPSGTLNLSAVDDFILYVEMSQNLSLTHGLLFANNYNWYKIQDGVFKLYSII